MKIRGAYFWSWNEAMFGSPKAPDEEVVTEEEILKLIPHLSKTKGERLLNLKEGSNLKLSHYHASGDLMIHRMTSQEIDNWKRVRELQEQASAIRKEIYNKTKDLQKELAQVEKELKKYEKRGLF